MSCMPGNHRLTAGWKRLLRLLRGGGVIRTLYICVSVIDDRWLRWFDRRYGVKTSGNIVLSSTSFERSKLGNATGYSPINFWAFRKLLKKMDLSKALHFVDLGCGLGRACILAGEYGFEKVTGVELAPELCATARENIANCRSRMMSPSAAHALRPPRRTRVREALPECLPPGTDKTVRSPRVVRTCVWNCR